MSPTELLQRLFIIRDDVYPLQLTSGGYEPARNGAGNRPLTADVLEQHIRGTICVGTYTLRGDRCKWICLDVDGAAKKADNARDAVAALVARCRHFGLIPYVESSGLKGWHIWIFCEELPAAVARTVGLGIVSETGPEALAGTQEVAVFPKQVRVDEGKYGNLVKLPWGKRKDNGQRGVFVDPDTLKPLKQAEQLALLEAVQPHPEEELTALVEENGWELREHFGSEEGGTASNYEEELPCYQYAISQHSAGVVPEGHRNNVLFAFASQNKRLGRKEPMAYRELFHINRVSCQPPLEEEEVFKITESCYRSSTSAACCDIIQAAGLCPVLLDHGVTCPIYLKTNEKKLQISAALNVEDDRLTLQPLRISDGDPPIYTATVRGQDLRLSLKELSNFRLFKEACIGKLKFVPRLPFVPTKDDPKKSMPAQWIWEEIVNEALASLIYEEAPPEDASPSGAAWDAICEFLSERKISEEREKLFAGYAVTEEGCFLFRGRDLRKWLKLTRNDVLSEHELWLLIRDHGGTSGPVRTKHGLVRVWKIRTDQIVREEEDVTEEPTCYVPPPPRGLLE